MENPPPCLPIHGAQPSRGMNAPLLQQPALFIPSSPAGSPGVPSCRREYAVAPKFVEIRSSWFHLVRVRWWEPAGEHWGCCFQVKQLGSSVIRLSVCVCVPLSACLPFLSGRVLRRICLWAAHTLSACRYTLSSCFCGTQAQGWSRPGSSSAGEYHRQRSCRSPHLVRVSLPRD